MASSNAPNLRGAFVHDHEDSSDDEIHARQQASSEIAPIKGGRSVEEPAFSRRTSEGDDGLKEDEDTGTSTPSDETAHEHRPTPFYNYATEKSYSLVDSKLIYQRHQLESRAGEGEGHSPLLQAKSAAIPAASEGEAGGLSRTTSLASRTSNRGSRLGDAFSIGSSASLNALPTHEPASEPNKQDPFLAADKLARSHAMHPGLPHEYKDPLLADQGVHGAGAGMGVGSGAGGYAPSETVVVAEIETICQNIKTLLDIRQKFLTLSLQCPGENPKDQDSWVIYPPPPEPVWRDDKARPATGGQGTNSMSNSGVISNSNADGVPQTPTSPARARRKVGQDIGADFDLSECTIPGASDLDFVMDEGSVFQVFRTLGKERRRVVDVPNLREYYVALNEIEKIASDGPSKSFAYRRLQYLEGRYNLYTLLNEYEEVADTKRVPHRDFYNVRKVDTHVHHSACMNQKHLLRFIKSKMKKSPDELVLFRDGQYLTLKEVFESINLTAYDLSIDTLDMHAHTDSFHRFDKFNLKYNPIGQSRLREIFLKTDNFIQGRYLAEITREVICDLESSKYQMVEWRISIYGRKLDEWDRLAGWVIDNKLLSHNVRWLIQIPRLYDTYKKSGLMSNFESVIRNIFQPLFEVTKDPRSHPKLHVFLQRVIGFDSVDDESKVERRFYRKYPTPKEWDTSQNPPYSYYIYFLYANMTALNAWRKERGFNTFLLRPHCGEAGDTDHLAAAILCCHSISHGITLRKVPILQYVFYLEQIGIAMSPLSNNALFLTYDRNPFVSYFRKGLNVSLSTDDPLQFAFTKEPLIEEYSVAAQIYKFSAVDMCELAKHSVDQSGFELQLKKRWLGNNCHFPGVLGNDVAKCNVPDVREGFRHETLKAEHAFIAKYTKDFSHYNRCNPDPKDLPPLSPVVAAHHIGRSALPNDPTQLARIPTSQSALEMESLNRSPQGDRRRSRSSTMLMSPVDSIVPGGEPRMFPGLVHERTRRQSLRLSTSGSDGVVDGNSGQTGLSKMATKDREALNGAVEEEPDAEAEST